MKKIKSFLLIIPFIIFIASSLYFTEWGYNKTTAGNEQDTINTAAANDTSATFRMQYKSTAYVEYTQTTLGTSGITFLQPFNELDGLRIRYLAADSSVYFERSTGNLGWKRVPFKKWERDDTTYTKLPCTAKTGTMIFDVPGIN